MTSLYRWTAGEIIFAVASLVFVLFLQGAIPFLMIPTLGQAVWTTGFAQSFTHGSLFTIYAHDFGIPKPTAIAFGLAGAWPVSVLLRLGMCAADAYATMLMLWLIVAFFSAYAIARKFANTRYFSLVGAVVWMSMPIIWNHSGYSMLSLGMSLLALYFFAAIKLFLIESELSKPSSLTIIFYFMATLISVFMDGYTFMMFFAGSTILCIFAMKTRVELLQMFKRTIFPVHIASFIFAYGLYSIFIGRAHFTKSPIDIFRGFGVDLSFLAIPTQGVHWWADLLGFSVARSGDMYFGDGSAWITTFSLPIILAGLCAWWLTRKKLKIATGVFIIALFAFYMSLGPSLKINSVKPAYTQGEKLGAAMPADLAVMPTGNAWMSKALPGFNNMRSAYRWTTLDVFAFWLLVMIAVPRTNKIGKVVWCLILWSVILLNLPNLPQKFTLDVVLRNNFLNIDSALIPMLQQQINKGEVVAFLPWNNDFFVNYLAPKAGFRSFNIGGDKDLIDAKKQWPEEMLAAGPGPLDEAKVLAGIKMLEAGTANVLVLPYIDLLWSAHNWPCGAEKMVRVPGDEYACLAQRKAEVAPFVKMLKAMPNVVVTESTLFATVRLVQP